MPTAHRGARVFAIWHRQPAGRSSKESRDVRHLPRMPLPQVIRPAALGRTVASGAPSVRVRIVAIATAAHALVEKPLRPGSGG